MWCSMKGFEYENQNTSWIWISTSNLALKTYKSFKSLHMWCSMVGFEFENQNTFWIWISVSNLDLKTYKSFKSLLMWCSMVGFEFENQNTQPNQRALNFNPTDKHSLSGRMSDCKLRCRTMGTKFEFCS